MTPQAADLVTALKDNYLFRDVPQDALASIASSASTLRFNGGDVIVRQFDKGTDLLVVLEGEAISKTFAEEIVARFGPGSVIGEVSLIDGQPRSTSVVSVKGTSVAVLPAEKLYRVMEEFPYVGYLIMRNLASLLCRRLRGMNEHVDAITGSRPTR